MNMEFGAAARRVFAGRTHVIFHIAAAEYTSGIYVFKARKDFFRRPLCNVRHHVQAKRVREFRNRATDTAETNDPHRQAVEFDEREIPVAPLPATGPFSVAHRVRVMAGAIAVGGNRSGCPRRP